MPKIQACNASNQCGVSYLAGTVSRSSRVRYQHTDMLGTPVMETDESGNVISRSVYEPFGKRLGGEKAGIGFTGHLQDEDLGLTYMQARYYDPLIGRFYSNDPVGYTSANPVMSFNRYLYVNNNPYKYTDPNGEFLVQLAATIGDAIIGGAAEYLTNDNASFPSVARASAVGGAVGLASSLGGGGVSSALLGGGANAGGEMANQIATGDFDGAKVVTAGATGLVGGALAKQVANVVKGALTKGFPNNSATSASHNMTQSSSQRVLAGSQSLTNAASKSTAAEIQVGTGYATGAAAGTAAADKVCEDC